MSTMSEAYRNAIADYGASLITHIGLVDTSGNEISGGGYERKSVTWTTASGGIIRPTSDLVFDVAGGVTVAGWRGFSAATGGTNYGGANFTGKTDSDDWQFKLLATQTGIRHENPS